MVNKLIFLLDQNDFGKRIKSLGDGDTTVPATTRATVLSFSRWLTPIVPENPGSNECKKCVIPDQGLEQYSA